MNDLGAKVVEGKDGTNYMRFHPILTTGETINLLEYATKIVSRRSCLGLVLYDFQGDTAKEPGDKNYIDPKAELQELIMDERSGLKRLTFICEAKIDNLFACFKSLKYESHQTIFLLPS